MSFWKGRKKEFVKKPPSAPAKNLSEQKILGVSGQGHIAFAVNVQGFGIAQKFK